MIYLYTYSSVAGLMDYFFLCVHCTVLQESRTESWIYSDSATREQFHKLQ